MLCYLTCSVIGRNGRLCGKGFPRKLQWRKKRTFAPVKCMRSWGCNMTLRSAKRTPVLSFVCVES